MEPLSSFETPEHVRVYYAAGGLGKRFVAWLMDEVIVFGVFVVLAVVFLVLAAATSQVLDNFGKLGSDNPKDLPLVFLGLLYMAFALGSLLYFGVSEQLMNGQTYGKKRMRLRVVRADGFTLTSGAVLLRSIFRVLDHLPPLWLIPLLTKSSQRLGDLVAGTVVVEESEGRLSPLRQQLSGRDAGQARFTFAVGKLTILTAEDIKAMEELLSRWASLPAGHRLTLGKRVAGALSSRLGLPAPADADTRYFIEDLLAARLQHDERKLD